MKFMIYATRNGAESRSRTEAQRRGCGPSSVTQFWWEVIEGADGSFACILEDDRDEEGMSSSDKSRLATTYQRRFPNSTRPPR